MIIALLFTLLLALSIALIVTNNEKKEITEKYQLLKEDRYTLMQHLANIETKLKITEHQLHNTQNQFNLTHDYLVNTTNN